VVSVRHFVILTVLSLSACIPPPPQVSLPAPYSEHGVKVVVDSLWKDDYGNVMGISGLATNESGRNLATCMLSLDVLDTTGIKVSSALASTVGLKAGQTWRFQAVFTNPFSVQFRSVLPGQLITYPP